MSALSGSAAVLAIWTDIDPGREVEFNAWYEREHIPDRLAVPGFLVGRRYRAVRGGPRYFAFYDVDAIASLDSAAYRARLNDPSAATSRVMPGFQDTTRALCRVDARVGEGVGGAILTLRLPRAVPRSEDLRSKIKALLEALYAQPGLGITRAEYWVDAGGSVFLSRESELRGNRDQSIDAAIVVEARSTDELDAIEAVLCGPGSPLVVGNRPQIAAAYRLLFALSTPPTT